MATAPTVQRHDHLAHSTSIQEIVEHFEVTPAVGLSEEEARERRKTHGVNALPEPQPLPAWRLFIRQFKNVLVLILALAAALAAAIGNTKDAVVICFVVVLNSAVGFYQEHRAEQSLAALKRMLPVRARARRRGQKVELAASELVPGDIALVEAGDRVPADGRLLLAIGLLVDESSLTGESKAVEKDAQWVSAMNTPLADRRNMVFMNTAVAKGRGEFLVTAIGAQTATGRISEQLAAEETRSSPLQVQLNDLGHRLGIASLILVVILFALQLRNGASLAREAMDAIALAVASVPEGLPVVVTVTLALGMHKLAHRGAIVRRMASVETLGCTTVICSDKTGTLTMNQMTVRALYFRGKHFSITGEGYTKAGEVMPEDSGAQPDYGPLVEPLVACNDSWLMDGNVVGDPMEGALLVAASKLALGGEPTPPPKRIGEIPFDSAHKFMATFHPEGDRVRMWLKGAPDVLLPRCRGWLNPQGTTATLKVAERDVVQGQYRGFAERGLRGLLIATRTIPAESFRTDANLMAWADDLTFLGLLGLQDPPRPEVKEAIARCKQAGIAIKMITGDHPDTARAIGRELGIEGSTLTGAELEPVSNEDLPNTLENVAVFARVAPEHKSRIVKALQDRGHVVAMTGDGVNDAPALKFADIGVAMGLTGTDVSKQAASMILTDDNFATIVTAVHHGRTLYENIVKFVRFQLATSMGAVLTVFFASLLGFPDPFNAIQILWVAIIMDGPLAVSLALDAPREGIMRERPRKRIEPILPTGRMLEVFGFGVVMTIGTLGVLRYGLQNGTEAHALTLAFTTFVLFQFFDVFNARSENRTCFDRHLFSNRMLWFSLLGAAALQVAAVHWSLARSVFGTTTLNLSDWGLATAVAASILILEELRKLVARLASQRSPSVAAFLLLCVLLAPGLAAAEIQSQHAFDTSISRGRWDAILHTRVRTLLDAPAFRQIRVGGIFEYALHRKASALGGYYFVKSANAGTWSTIHRPFCGLEIDALRYRGAAIGSRTLVESFLVPDRPNFNRYRQRLMVASATQRNGPYVSVEGFFDRRGPRSVRYAAGWRTKATKNLSLDVGYFYEDPLAAGVAARHVLISAVHFRVKAQRADPDI